MVQALVSYLDERMANGVAKRENEFVLMRAKRTSIDL